MQAINNAEYDLLRNLLQEGAATSKIRHDAGFYEQGSLGYNGFTCHYLFGSDDVLLITFLLPGENIRSRLNNPNNIYRQLGTGWASITPGGFPDLTTEQLSQYCLKEVLARSK